MAGELARIRYPDQRHGQNWQPVKRLIDLAGATLCLLVLSPLLVVIAILIRLDTSGPVLYRSFRMGRDGQPFLFYKFRTMYTGSPPRHAADGSLVVDSDDPRVTRAGHWLRSGLDELPQLYNVIRGEMSLVGPRADPPEALVSYRPGDASRFGMRPGITGLAQVCGRTAIPIDERRAFDRLYVERWRPLMDFYVCLLTMFELAPGLDRLPGQLHRRLASALSRLTEDRVLGK